MAIQDWHGNVIFLSALPAVSVTLLVKKGTRYYGAFYSRGAPEARTILTFRIRPDPMITTLRHLLIDSWAGRAAAILIFLAFIGWGIGDIYSNLGAGNANTIIQVGNRTVTPDDFSHALSAQLPAAARQMGISDPSKIPAGAKEQIARQVLHNLVIQNELQLAAERAGLDVPDSLIRKEIFAIPAFHNAAGQFDHTIFNQWLAQRGLTEKSVIQMIREDIISRGTIAGLGVSAKAPASLLAHLLDYNSNQRIFDVVRIPFAGGTPPISPTDAQIQRYYDNHPQNFRTTEYRHARMVIMTAESVAKTIEVPDDVLHRIYDLQARTYNLPETRTIQVLTFQNDSQAQAAATFWRNSGSWEGVQKAYPDAAAVALPHIRQSDIPNPDLAKAAFGVTANQISGPTKTGAGWVVFNITDILAPHSTPFDQVKTSLTEQVRKQEASEALQARLKQFQDTVAGSTTLDKIPADLGAVAAAGTLDAQGMTEDGNPAPIPGSPALRKLIVQTIFLQKKGEQPKVVSGPDGTAFAVVVDEVRPGSVRPLSEVHEQVVQAWTEEQKRHAADMRATTLFTNAKKTTLEQALQGQPENSDLRTGMTASRVHPAATLPRNVLEAVFNLKVGATGMYQDADAFWLVNVTGNKPAQQQDDQTLLHEMETQYLQALQADIPLALEATLEKANPPTKFNVSLFNQVVASTSPSARAQ